MISYDELVQRMNTAYVKQTGFVPNEASDTAVRFRVLAGEVYSLLTNLEWLKQSLLPQTAVGEQLDKLAQEQGLNRAAAACAQGKLQFTITQDAIVPAVLPIGMRCTTDGNNPVLVETLEELRLPIEAGKAAFIKAKTVETGAAGNVAAGAVTVLVTANPYVASVTNPQAFTGGRDAQTDSQLREQLLELGKQQSNGTNLAFYRQLAEQQAGVTSAYVQAAVPAAGEVTVWLAGSGTAVSDAVVQQVQQVMDEARELNVKVHVYPAKTTPVAVAVIVQEKDGQSESAVSDAVRQVVQSGFAALKVGETVNAAQVCAWGYNTGLVQNITVKSSTSFPQADADMLVTLESVEVDA